MQRLSLVLILLGALGAGAWLLLQPGAAAPTTVHTATGEADPAPPAPGALTTPLAAAAAAATSDALERSEAPAAAAASAAAGYAIPAAADAGFPVSVVRKEDQTPLPFAEVFFLDLATVDEQRMRSVMAEALSLFEMIEKLAVRYRTDADGRVRLPLPQERVWLAARKERWFGTLEERVATSAGMVIECTEISAVAARVTDQAGVPQAGIPVQLRFIHEGRDDGAIAVRTDERGFALIQPLDMLTKNAPAGATFALALGGVLAEPVRQEFDAAHPPAQPLDLVLPPHGALEVRVFGLDGGPWLEPAFVQALPPGLPPERRGGEVAQGLAGPVRAGVATLLPVGLGQPLRVRALRGDGSALGEALCSGPERDGATVTVEIREQAGASFLVGRLVHADGTPYRRENMRYELERRSGGGSSSQSSRMRTDAEGGFRLAIEEPAVAAQEQRLLTFRAGGDRRAGAAARVDRSWTLPPGPTQQGTVPRVQPPLLASGFIVDAAGAPLAGATIRASAQYFYNAENFYWNWDGSMSSPSLPDGSFALYGAVQGERIRLEGSLPLYWCAGVETVPGATGVQVVMQRAGRVAGTVQLDAGENAGDYMLTLTQGAAEDPQSPRATVILEGDGRFAFESVAPGVCRLDLLPLGSSHVFATLDGLSVVAGEDCADPRLHPFDARGLTRSLRLRAVNAAGEPVPNFRVREMRADGGEDEFYANQGEVRVPVRAAASDFLVVAEGFLTVSLPRVTQDQEVRMQPGPRVRITLTGAWSLPAGHRLQVGLQAAEPGAASDWNSPQTEVDASGVVEFDATQTGLCRVLIIVLATTNRVTHAAWIEQSDTLITILPAGGVQSFALELDAAKFQAALDRLANMRR